MPLLPAGGLPYCSTTFMWRNLAHKPGSSKSHVRPGCAIGENHSDARKPATLMAQDDASWRASFVCA